MQEVVWNVTGVKMSLFGYSQGTTSLMYSIAELPDFHEQYTNVVGLQAPCGVMDEGQTHIVYNRFWIDFLHDNDIWTIAYGPNWEENK
jgi:hypothetical protein